MRTLAPLTLLLALVACAAGGTDKDTDTDTDGTTDDTDAAVEIEVSVSPSSPLAGEDLDCDAEGGVGELTFRWERDGDDADIEDDEVDGDEVDAYQEWKCIVEDAAGNTGDDEVDIEEACTSLSVARGDIALQDYDAALDMLGKSFTVEAWVLPQQPTPRAFGVLQLFDIVRRGTTLLAAAAPVQGEDYALTTDPNGNLYFVTGSFSDSCATLVARGALADGAWSHVAGVWDQTTGDKRLYVNGAVVASCNTTVRTEVADGPVTVGGSWGKGPYRVFPGYIDEVRLSSTVRYDAAFTPKPYFYADSDTAWLLHMNDLESFDNGDYIYTGTTDSSESALHPQLYNGRGISDRYSACDGVGVPPEPVDTDTDGDTADTAWDTDIVW